MTQYEKLSQKIEKCNEINIENINISEIDEVKNIKVDKDLSSIDRIIEFINRTKNPYIINVDGIIVKMEYGNNNINAMNCIKKIVIDNS